MLRLSFLMVEQAMIAQRFKVSAHPVVMGRVFVRSIGCAGVRNHPVDGRDQAFLWSSNDVFAKSIRCRSYANRQVSICVSIKFYNTPRAVSWDLHGAADTA